MDFAVVKEIVRPVLEALDHRVLVPANNVNLEVTADGDFTKVEYLGRPRFVFPRSHVALVPVSETTAELLAGYLAAQVAGQLNGRGLEGVRSIVVDLEESPGQSGRCQLTALTGGDDESNRSPLA